MKKLLLIILSAMAFAGIAMAQDVYTSGYYMQDGNASAAVYKNGERLYSCSSSSDLTSDDVLYFDGNVYWVDNCHNADGTYNYGDVFKNGDRWLSNPMNSGTTITCLFHDDEGNVYAAGSKDYDGNQAAVVWKNDDNTVYSLVNYNTFISDAAMVDGKIVACGYFTTSAQGFVWWDVTSTQITNLGNGIIPGGLAIYNGDVYTIVTDINSNTSLVKVLKNEQVLYTLSSNTYGTGISIDGGDIYTVENSYFGSGYRVWKNDSMIYEQTDEVGCIEANSEGVFYAGLEWVYKNGQAIYGPEAQTIFTGISVDLGCTNSNVRTLPYFEGFETGETDWRCWTKEDRDGNNGMRPSYWHRFGGVLNQGPSIVSGDYCAYHHWNADADQEGRLTSPTIAIPSDGATLTFKTCERYPGDYHHESVWIWLGNQGARVWMQDEPSVEWKTVSIDLAEYKNQNIQVEFRYMGSDAHGWYIDDVSITPGSTGVDENEEVGLAVYPNPARDRIRIEGLEVGSTVQVFNALGELVKTARVSADNEIGIGELASGLYLVRCGNMTCRFVKE